MKKLNSISRSMMVNSIRRFLNFPRIYLFGLCIDEAKLPPNYRSDRLYVAIKMSNAKIRMSDLAHIESLLDEEGFSYRYEIFDYDKLTLEIQNFLEENAYIWENDQRVR